MLLKDNAGKQAQREFQVAADKWYPQKFNVGKKYEGEWGSVDSGFNWAVINEVWWYMWFS